jgi:hypothetical protein
MGRREEALPAAGPGLEVGGEEALDEVAHAQEELGFEGLQKLARAAVTRRV